MISSEKIDVASNLLDISTSNIAKQNKWNEQPHIGKYKLIKTIGKGNFAKVKLAQHVTTGKKVAVKVIDKTALNNSSLQKLFREVKLMKTLEHPNIVKLFEVIESERHVYLVMEYASKGEVFDFLVQNGRMKEKEARQRFREIVSAIQYCHHKNIVHRDLKAENLLLNSDLEIKIADFGFANTFDSKKQLDTFCGSPPYAAPELFQGRKYDGPEVDVWSLGVILYTLVSGSLPFDGHNMRELRDRVLRGKYRIPFYMSTDCELLLKKMLIVNPQKRITLLEVMKEKWINIGYEDCPLHPYIEPAKNYEDPLRLAIMENLGFSKDEVLDSLYNSKFNNITATYLLLDHDVNNALENSSKSASVNSLKNINSCLSPQDLAKITAQGNEKSSKAVTRSGSAIESRFNKKVATNGDSKDQHHVTQNENEDPIIGDGETSHGEPYLKVKGGTITSTIKQSPSMGTTNNTFANDEVPQLVHASLRSRPNPIRIPGIQPNLNSTGPKLNEDQAELNNGDHLLIPTKNNTWVKRNNTFTYADKNISSGIEPKPVTRAKHVMNMLSQETPSTTPLNMDDESVGGAHNLNIHGSNNGIITNCKTQGSNDMMTTHLLNETQMADSMIDEVTVTINDQPSATGDKHVKVIQSSNEDHDILAQNTIDETVHNLQTMPLVSTNHPTSDTVTSVNTSVSSSKEPNDVYHQLNKPKQVHSSSLFRSFTNRISSKPHVVKDSHINESLSPNENAVVSENVRRHSTGDKLIRRLTTQNQPSNRNKRASEFDPNNTADPWTQADTTVLSNDKRCQISASSDISGDKTQYLDKAHQASILKPNQSKPRLMHLVFRKNFTSKLRPDVTISEILKSLCATDEIEFKKIEQSNSFVIDCQGRLKSDQGGNELIHWEIEVFRLPRSSTSLGVRIKKESGSSTRFKAIQKLLINKLSPVLCTSPTPRV